MLWICGVEILLETQMQDLTSDPLLYVQSVDLLHGAYGIHIYLG